MSPTRCTMERSCCTSCALPEPTSAASLACQSVESGQPHSPTARHGCAFIAFLVARSCADALHSQRCRSLGRLAIVLIFMRRKCTIWGPPRADTS